MAHRLVHYCAIASRREWPAGFVSPDDFQLVLRAASDTATLPRGALAYCADLVRERVLFTCHSEADSRAMFANAFLFMQQLRLAGSVVSVPCEKLDSLGLDDAGHPTLIFSPGRTGSTLLAKLLQACGVPCASEPDMLTQLACVSDEDRLQRPPGTDIFMARACMASITRNLGPGACIKLRSHCNANPLFVLGAAGGGRVVFLLRHAASWALSRYRAFSEGPAHIAGLLGQALDALDTVHRAGVPVEVLRYETMVKDPMLALRVCVPHILPDAAAVAAVMRRDSQEGTLLDRERLISAGVAEGFMEAFESTWRDLCFRARWSDRVVELAAQMQVVNHEGR